MSLRHVGFIQPNTYSVLLTLPYDRSTLKSAASIQPTTPFTSRECVKDPFAMDKG